MNIFVQRKSGPKSNCRRNPNIYYNTPGESHQNERVLEDVKLWNCIVEDDLKELIGTTYTNKIHLLFGSLSLKNFIVKHP